MTIVVQKYRDIQVTLGTLDEELSSNWLKYSNILIQVCSEMPSGSDKQQQQQADQQKDHKENNSGAAGKNGK